MPSDIKENQLCNLNTEKLRDCINLTLETLEKVLHFIADNDLKQPDRVDYINYLIGYLYELFINMYLQEVRQLVKRGIK